MDRSARPQCFERHSGRISVTVIIPAYDEAPLLERTAGQVRSSLESLSVEYQIVLVDDGSTDGTGAIADRLAERPGFFALHQPNAGVGGALKRGVEVANGTYTLFWPADMACEPGDLAPFLERAGRADVIVGHRRHRVGYNPLMRLNAALYPLLVRLLFGLRLRDVNWVCLYRTELFRRIEITEDGIPMLAEILVRIRDLGGNFEEIEVEMQAREQGTASAARFRVMVGTLAGLLRLWWRWRRQPNRRVPRASR